MLKATTMMQQINSGVGRDPVLSALLNVSILAASEQRNQNILSCNDFLPSSSLDTCARGYCSPRQAADVGDTCGVREHCLEGSQCSQNICGGPGALCLTPDGSSTGTSAECAQGRELTRNVCRDHWH
jgi:hypothetical protein